MLSHTLIVLIAVSSSFTHTHYTLWYIRLSSLCIIEQNPHKFFLICALLQKKIINKTQTFLYLSLCYLPSKNSFYSLGFMSNSIIFFLHPIGKDPWAKVIKFFIAQSTFNTSISIPWWTRTTILLWKGIGFSFTRRNRFFFFFPCHWISKND